MNRSFKDVEHLIRLAALFAVGVLLFAVARAVFVPKDFGKYGHYRAGAIDDAAAQPLSYAGRARCAECCGWVLDSFVVRSFWHRFWRIVLGSLVVAHIAWLRRLHSHHILDRARQQTAAWKEREDAWSASFPSQRPQS